MIIDSAYISASGTLGATTPSSTDPLLPAKERALVAGQKISEWAKQGIKDAKAGRFDPNKQNGGSQRYADFLSGGDFLIGKLSQAYQDSGRDLSVGRIVEASVEAQTAARNKTVQYATDVSLLNRAVLRIDEGVQMLGAAIGAGLSWTASKIIVPVAIAATAIGAVYLGVKAYSTGKWKATSNPLRGVYYNGKAVTLHSPGRADEDGDIPGHIIVRKKNIYGYARPRLAGNRIIYNFIPSDAADPSHRRAGKNPWHPAVHPESLKEARFERHEKGDPRKGLVLAVSSPGAAPIFHVVDTAAHKKGEPCVVGTFASRAEALRAIREVKVLGNPLPPQVIEEARTNPPFSVRGAEEWYWSGYGNGGDASDKAHRLQAHGWTAIRLWKRPDGTFAVSAQGFQVSDEDKIEDTRHAQ